MLTRTQDVFGDLLNVKPHNLTQLCHNFKADLRDVEGRVLKQHTLTPHVLRHARIYAWVKDHGFDEPYIVELAGWRSSAMMWHYADLAAHLTIKSQLKHIQESGYLKAARKIAKSEF
jgi:integrase